MAQWKWIADGQLLTIAHHRRNHYIERRRGADGRQRDVRTGGNEMDYRHKRQAAGIVVILTPPIS